MAVTQGCQNTLVRRIGVRDASRLGSRAAFSGRKSEPSNPSNAQDLPFRTQRPARCHSKKETVAKQTKVLSSVTLEATESFLRRNADVLWTLETRAQRAQRRDRVAGQIAKILDGYLEERESSQTPKETATPLLKAKFLDGRLETESSPVSHEGDQSPLLKRGNAGNSQLNIVDSNHKASTQQGILAPQSTQQSVECVGLNLD
ncbi:uncharacterized protein LOC112589475 [Harpegnathos saltator]|uniref:uncharacterized protein LOC112589475 n=1 Tax=Harpegnathos saltator TaxID=610380 RepID=UPI000DBEEB68|nr:uncharacterized protein LOC112589475 [Harpegnathos saltator]